MNLLNTTAAADDDVQKQIAAFVLDSLALLRRFQCSCNRYTGSLIVAVTYGYIAHGDEDPFLTRVRELLDISTRVVTPEKAALFTAFSFREFHSPVVDLNLNVGNIGYSPTFAKVVLWWRLCPDGTW